MVYARRILPGGGCAPGPAPLLAVPVRGAVCGQGVALAVLLLVLLGLHAVLSAVALPFGALPRRRALRWRRASATSTSSSPTPSTRWPPRRGSSWSGTGRWQCCPTSRTPRPPGTPSAASRRWPSTNPKSLSLLLHIQLNMQLVAQTASNAQQMHEVYTPDYTPVRDLLDLLDTDVDAALAPPSPAASDQGICPFCAVP